MKSICSWFSPFRIGVSNNFNNGFITFRCASSSFTKQCESIVYMQIVNGARALFHTWLSLKVQKNVQRAMRVSDSPLALLTHGSLARRHFDLLKASKETWERIISCHSLHAADLVKWAQGWLAWLTGTFTWKCTIINVIRCALHAVKRPITRATGALLRNYKRKWWHKFPQYGHWS